MDNREVLEQMGKTCSSDNECKECEMQFECLREIRERENSTNIETRAISTAQVWDAVDGLERLKETLEVLRHPVTGKIQELHGDSIDKAILAIKIAYGLN